MDIILFDSSILDLANVVTREIYLNDYLQAIRIRDIILPAFVRTGAAPGPLP